MPRLPPSSPKPLSHDWLLQAALRYLQQYAASTQHLRALLLAKAIRRQGNPDADRETRHHQRRQASQMVDKVLDHLLHLRLLDDNAFANARLQSLRRKGTSKRAAEAKLSKKGLTRETVGEALRQDETSEEEAAAAFVRRHRLGASGLRPDDPEHRRKALAKMMRAGFDRRTAQEALDRRDDEGEGSPFRE